MTAWTPSYALSYASGVCRALPHAAGRHTDFLIVREECGRREYEFELGICKDPIGGEIDQVQSTSGCSARSKHGPNCLHHGRRITGKADDPCAHDMTSSISLRLGRCTFWTVLAEPTILLRRAESWVLGPRKSQGPLRPSPHLSPVASGTYSADHHLSPFPHAPPSAASQAIAAAMILHGAFLETPQQSVKIKQIPVQPCHAEFAKRSCAQPWTFSSSWYRYFKHQCAQFYRVSTADWSWID